MVNRQKTQQSEVATHVAVQLAKYKKLREDEEKLRDKVEALEEQIAITGLRKTDISKSKLGKEKAELEKIRHELNALNEQLQQQNNVSPDLKKEIDADTLTLLMSEFKSKRALAIRHHKNILFLEEKDGSEAEELALANELEETRSKLDEIRIQLSQIENEVYSRWGVNLRKLDFRSMDEKKIAELAYNIVEKKYDYDIEPVAYTKKDEDTVVAGFSSEQKNTVKPRFNRPENLKQQVPIYQIKANEIKTQNREAYIRFTRRITKVLEEYKDAIYPTCDVKYSELNGSWTISKKNRNQDVEVKIRATVIISGEPLYYYCEMGSNAKHSKDLSRRSLIAALIELHIIENKKQWWKFWIKSLPKGWL